MIKEKDWYIFVLNFLNYKHFLIQQNFTYIFMDHKENDFNMSPTATY